jgi:hypothetical protein
VSKHKKNVSVLFSKKSASLVEYIDDEDTTIRVSVPASSITDGPERVVENDILEAGIPYGVPWAAKIGDFSLKGADIEKEFHNSGIWTFEDYQANPQNVIGAIMAVARPVMQAIAILVKENANK